MNRFQRSQQRQAAAQRAAGSKVAAPRLQGAALVKVRAELAAAARNAKIGPAEQRELLTRVARRCAEEGTKPGARPGILRDPTRVLRALALVLTDREATRARRKAADDARRPATDLARWQDAEASRKGMTLTMRSRSKNLPAVEAAAAFAEGAQPDAVLDITPSIKIEETDTDAADQQQPAAQAPGVGSGNAPPSA